MAVCLPAQPPTRGVPAHVSPVLCPRPPRIPSCLPPTLGPAVGGRWQPSRESRVLPDPLNGEPFIAVPHTRPDELDPFVASLKAVPKSGLHNPLKNPERCPRPGNQ